jgi:hypothetical protein
VADQPFAVPSKVHRDYGIFFVRRRLNAYTGKQRNPIGLRASRLRDGGYYEDGRTGRCPMRTCEMVCDEDGLFILVNGVRIAERSDGKRLSLEPGYAVYDSPENPLTGEGGIVIEQNGVAVQ